MKTPTYIVVILLSLFIGAQGAAAQKQVKLLSLTWEPYVGLEMPQKGISAAIVRMAFEKAGYAVEIEFHNWDQSLEMAKAGEADGLFPTYHTEEREAYFLYSEPFGNSYLGLCKERPVHAFSPGGIEYDKKKKYRRELIQYKTDPRIDQTQALRDLQQYKFGVGRGYANTPEFDAADFLTKIEVANDEENILQLLQGEVELIVIDKYVAKNIIAKKFPWRSGDVEFMDPPLAIKALYLTVSKKTDRAQEKVREFNAGLQILQKEGKIKRLLRVYGF
ncbi:MAG: transporter substrate-binding domain-containing protein [Desulfosarcinaceae bacterium]|nr:transporter substrate-binding domain-containing protein [Desulfosarcinaceae bacterium]